MFKRFLCMALALCLAVAACFCAAANGLPFDKPDAPADLVFVFSNPNKSHECIDAVFTVPDALCRVASLTQSQQEKYYGAVFENCVQFDWSVDSRDAFHYDESWDSIGGSYPLQRIGGGFLEKSEVFWFEYDADAQRCAPGVTEKNGVRAFDFDNHQLYVRARFMIYDYLSETCTFSDWSDIYGVGADRDAQAPDTPQVGESRIELSKASFSDGTLSFDAKPAGSVRDIARAMLIGTGAQLSIESQVRVNGGMWEYRSMSRGEEPYLVGMRDIALDDTEGKVEFRCRLSGNNPADGSAVVTGWSDLITVEDGKVQIVKNDDRFDIKAEQQRLEEERLRQEEALREANRCKLCGICPIHPLGVCMFVWIGMLLFAVLVAYYFISTARKKKARAAQTKAREAASRQDSTDKTGSFVMTDRVHLRDSSPEEDAVKQEEEKEDTQKETPEDTQEEDAKDES